MGAAGLFLLSHLRVHPREWRDPLVAATGAASYQP
jgi:hypothetical protein